MHYNLYVKSNYSLLESLLSLADIIDYNLSKGHKAAIICDNNMYGVMDFIKQCHDKNIKPVIGLEVTISNNKVLLFVKNYQGYTNLIKICTYQNDQTLTIDKLLSHKDNLYFLIPYSNLDFYNKYKDELTDIYLGYSTKEEEQAALVQTNNIVCLRECLYKTKEDSIYLKYLYLIKDGKTLNDQIEYNVINKELHTNNSLEKEDSIGLINTIKIVNDCNLELPKAELLLPIYDCPHNMDSATYLRNLSLKGLSKRLANKVTKEYLNRLNYELKVITDMGFANYFLVVYDFIKYAKKKKILVGPGRGSAAGSLVAYCLGITEIDPLEYNLLFERFLNPERKTMPDIDTDIPDLYRDDIINYVTNKYGSKKVAGIVTFATLASKQALRDVGRIFNIPTYKIDKLTSYIPAMSHKKLLDFYNEDIKFKEYILSDESLKQVFKTALKLEGAKRQIGTHAAGIVMCKKDLDEVIPLTKNDDMYLTGYAMNYLEELGLLKMDFLGIRNLTIIMNVLDMIAINQHLTIDFNNIPLNDEATYNLFKNANTSGIFQFESSGMRKFLRKLKPSNFNDLVAAIALFRPGPAENIDLYIARKEGIVPTTYLDQSLENVLKDTYGIMIYQEQIMQVASLYAGYSLGEADILRRAISKKKVDILKEEETKFLEKSKKLGHDLETAKTIFASILKFAGYGFNKSHAVAYSLVAYKMAYLKVHYPLEFYANLLNNTIGVESKTKEYLREIKTHNLKVVKPDINYSEDHFITKNKTIIFPFSSIKGIGINVCKNIVDARNNKEFSDLYDAFSRLIRGHITKKQLETLILAGVFDRFNYTRKCLLTNLDSLYNYGELTLDLDESLVLKPEIENMTEYSKNTLLEQELACFGFYISNHPATVYKSKYQNIIDLNLLGNYFNRQVNVIVMIEKIKTIKTKKNEDMAFITGSDETGVLDFIFFPKTYKLYMDLTKGDICMLRGNVERRYDELQLVVNKVTYLRRNDEEN